MNLDQIETKCFILALFIRDDGERFLLGSGAYEFKEKQMHFIANSYQNDIVEVQGNDGIMLAGQVRRPSTQPFDGYIADATVNMEDTEEYRRDFLTFFRPNYYYKVVYVFPNGEAIQRRKGFIVDAPEIKELYQIFPEYHVALNFEDLNYYSYTEDADGNETYAKIATISPSAGVADGGLVWDEVGTTWDSIGAIWEQGSGGGPTTVMVDSVDRVYPIWELKGPVVNPSLSDLATNTTLYYNGSVTASQTLVIDMFNRTAYLNGTSVIGNITGEWVSFAPGNNRVIYLADNPDAVDSKIYWQEVVG